MIKKLRHLANTSRALRLAMVLAGMALIASLGSIRVRTEAQFAFATLMLIPIVANAWVGGRAVGWLSAMLGSALWGYADHAVNTGSSASLVPAMNALVHLLNYGFVVELVRWVQLLLEQEAKNARTDKLTTLLNRRGFIEVAEQQAGLAQRLQTPISVAFIDLDRFKQLNDTRGHKAGDVALRRFGETLQEELRSVDVIGRLGGDEFCVVLLDKSVDAVTTTARRLHETLTAAMADFPPVSVSIGVAFFESPRRSLDEMLRLADDILYEVKHAGRAAMKVRAF